MKRSIVILLLSLLIFCYFTSCTPKQHPVIYCKYRHAIKKRLKKRRARKHNYHSKRKENYEKARAKNKKYIK